MLQVADEFLSRGQVIGDLTGRHSRQQRARGIEQPRIALPDVRVAVRRVPPRFVFLQVTPDVDIEVPESLQPVDVSRVEAGTAGDAACDLVVVDVGRLPRIALEIRVRAAAKHVAAGFADVLDQCAGDRDRGRVPDGLDGNLREGRKVGQVDVVDTVGLARPDTFDLVAVHAGGRPQAVGRVLLHGQRAVPAHVHLRHRHARRAGQDGEGVARAGQCRELVAVEVRGDLVGREVDEGHAGDEDAVGDAARTELGVNGCCEAETDVDGLAHDRRETRERKRDSIVTGRDRRKAVGSCVVGDRRLDGHQCRPREGDCNAGHDGVAAVDDDAIDGTCRRRDGLRGRRGDRGDDHDPECQTARTRFPIRRRERKQQTEISCWPVRWPAIPLLSQIRDLPRVDRENGERSV